MRYSAFISYNHRDRRWASWLHRELERYKIPRPLLGRDSGVGPLGRHLPPVFQDRQELAASTDLAASVRDALSQSASLIVICSKNGAASRWVNEEVREFIRLGRRDRIQCMIVPEAAAGSSEASRLEEVVPPALLELGSEPLAADARKSGDGKGFAFLKLVAGIIGVRFDELRQREQIRRQRRLLAFAGAASVGFLLTTGLSAFAFISRAEAVRQRDIARQETMTAERTTDFVKGLFQVSDPSEAKGQSITAREVLDRGAVQIEGSLDNEPDVKADLISTLSEVYMGLGSFRRADGLIRRSLSLNVARPETRARQLGVLASSQALQGNYENAVSGFVHALAFIKKPAALQDPSLYSKLLAGEAESDAALERYGPASQLAGAAIRWDRKNSGAASPAVARDLESSGLVAQYSGDLATAQKSYSGALSIRMAKDGRLHPKVAEDLNELGTVAYLQGDGPAAERYFKQSLALEQQVIGPNHPDLGTTLNNLARVLLEQRKFAEAVPLLTRSENIDLAQRTDTHDDLAFIFSNLALAKQGVGDSASAELLFKRALHAAQVHQNRLIAPIMVDLAGLECRQGKDAEALDLLARAEPIMRAKYPQDAWRSAWLQNTRGDCLRRMGRVREGSSLIRSSAPVVLKRWPPSTMYGYEAEQRSLAIAIH
jgi:tetratricopeptide (TPR) repeat protein